MLVETSVDWSQPLRLGPPRRRVKVPSSKVHARRRRGRRQVRRALAPLRTLNGAYGSPDRDGPRWFLSPGCGAYITFVAPALVATARQNYTETGNENHRGSFHQSAAVGPYEVDPDCAARFFLPDAVVFVHAVVVMKATKLFICEPSTLIPSTGL